MAKRRYLGFTKKRNLEAKVVENLKRLGEDKRRRLAEAAQLDPLAWQARHGHAGETGPSVEPVPLQVKDAQGRIGAPQARTVDTVGRLLHAKAITKPCADAGRDFEEAFARAGLEPLRAASLSPSVQGAPPDGYPGFAVKREEIWRATQALGGMTSPLALAAWDVLGWRYTLAQFAGRQSFGPGRSIHVQVAKGLVIGALWGLARHYRRI